MVAWLVRHAILVSAMILAGSVRSGGQGQRGAGSPISGGELIRMQLPLQPIQPTPEDLQRWASAPHQPFGPFDESRSSFRSIDVTLDAKPFTCPSFMTRDHSVIRIILAIRRASGAADYWRLAEGPPQTDDDLCERNTTWWSIADFVGDAPTIEFATPDPAVPLFRVGLGADWQSGSTSEYTTNQLIIDVRTAQPVLLARLSSLVIDGYCAFAPERPLSSCAWDAGQRDMLCTDSFRDARRYVWMTSGERLPSPPGSSAPRDLSEFIDALTASDHPIGKWAEPADVGAVRLVASWSGTQPDRRFFLFGASDLVAAPFVLAVREGRRTLTIPVMIDGVSGYALPDPVVDDGPPMPIAEYRSAGEPPVFQAQGLAQDSRGTRLLRIVMTAKSGTRKVYHVAIGETSGTIVAHAIHFATSSRDSEESFAALRSDGPLDACQHTEGGFARARRIRLAPLRIDYDIEPSFDLRGEGPERMAPCVAAAHAEWQPGKGFAIGFESGLCSTTRFRAVHIRLDGSLDLRTRTSHQQ